MSGESESRGGRRAPVRAAAAAVAALAALSGTACAPEPGSEAWCEKMRETPKGDWSANETVEFAKSCVLP